MVNFRCVWVAVSFSFSRAHHKIMLLQTIPVERTREHEILEKVRGTKDQRTDRGIYALTREFSTLTRGKCHGPGRVRSGGFQNLAGRVGSGQEGFKISRIGSGRVKRFSKSRGSGRVGSGQDVSKVSRVESGPVKSPGALVLLWCLCLRCCFGHFPWSTGKKAVVMVRN